MIKKYLLSLALLLAVNVSAQTVKNLKVETALTPSYLTQGSLTFAGSGGILTQDNSNIFWDDTNNRLGIGTTAPTNPLTISTSGASSAFNTVDATSTIYRRFAIEYPSTYGTRLQVSNFFNITGDGNGLFTTFNIPTPQTNTSYFSFTMGATTMLMIRDSGNVGINVTSPTSQLQINTSSASTVGTIVKGSVSQTSDLSQWQDSAGTVLSLVNSAGGLNIGTTDTINTGSKLKIAGGVLQIANAVGTDNVSLNKGITMGSAVSDSSSFFNVGSGSGWKMIFTTGGGGVYNGSNVRMTVMDAGVNFGTSLATPTGVVDIGTTSASTKGLIVRGSASQAANLTEWQNVGGTKLASVSNTGEIYLEVSGKSFGNNAGSFGLDAYSTTVDTTVTVRNSYASQIANLLVEGGISAGNVTLAASAILQADSTTKGFLPPRMTTAQKNAIGTPATGLVVYDTTLNKLCVYTGAAWETITSL